MTKPDPKRFLDLARAAAVENATEKSVSSFVELIDEGDGAFSFVFESKLEGYKGWLWSVTLYDSGYEAPTISEVVLLPGENALLAPAWVPWSERLADYQALQAELEKQAALDAEEAALKETDEETEEEAEEESPDEAEEEAEEELAVADSEVSEETEK